MINKISAYIFILFLLSGCMKNQIKKNMAETSIQKIEDVYQTVQHRESKVFYDLKIYNGACNYKVLINDVPVHEMYNNVRGEFSLGINNLILKSGQQRLKIRIFPFYDENGKLNNKLHRYAGLDVTVREMEWNEEYRKFDYYPVFSYVTPRKGNKSLEDDPTEFLLKDEELPYYEEEVIFEAKVPYDLKGWSESVNLKNENSENLKKEAIAYYESLAKDFTNRNTAAIAKKYYKKEKEIAQCFFHSQKEAKTRFYVDIMERILDPTAKVRKLEKYDIKFFGDGKIVALMRHPGVSPICIVTKRDNGDLRYSVYDVFLHRPTPSAKLEMIR